MIEVKRFGKGTRTIVILDGEPLPLKIAAERCGVSKKAMQKRIERGSDLAMPRKRGTWAIHGL